MTSVLWEWGKEGRRNLRFVLTPLMPRHCGSKPGRASPSPGPLHVIDPHRVQYGGQYERAKFAHSAADAATMLLFGMASLLLLDLALPPARIGFHGLSLLYMLVYAWSRANPTAQVSFMGLLTLPGLYLPGVFVAMDLLQGQSVAAPLLGIAAGHL